MPRDTQEISRAIPFSQILSVCSEKFSPTATGAVRKFHPTPTSSSCSSALLVHLVSQEIELEFSSSLAVVAL